MHSFPLAKKKKFTIIMGLSLVIIAVAMVIGVSAPFFNRNFVNASSNQVVLKNVSDGYLSGCYKIISANNEKLCFDVCGGMEMKNSVKIIAHESHTNSNQKFNFSAIDFNNSYIYTITTSYCDGYVLDINGGSSADNTNLQIYEYNGTVAQKFMIKAVYQGEEFKGYVILTGSSGYEKALTKASENIVQKTFNYNTLDLNQVWFFEQAFYGYSYEKSGYYDSNKCSGAYNSINYDISGNHNGGYYLNIDYWEKLEHFITIDTSSSFKAKNAKISSNGYTFLDSVKLDLKIDNSLKIKYQQILWKKYYVQVGSDSSNYVNGKYVNGTVGMGSMEIEYIDDSGNKYSEFVNNIFSNASTSNCFFSKNFNKVGKYSVRFYYKVTADLTTYVMKEINFAVISSSGTGTAVSAISTEEEKQVISSYSFSLDKNSNITVVYDGDEEFRAKDEDIVNYVAGATLVDTSEEINEKQEKLKEKIKKYKEYKVFFTNGAFYMDAYGNAFTEITELIQGYSSVVTNMYRGHSSINNTDGIYEYEIRNLYKTEKSYYKVYVQCQPNQQVFRNVTYCYKNEDGEIINYAIDYAFLEDLKIFPYTMTAKIYYENLDDENATPVEYESNSIIYNTSDDILKLKFTVSDLSGNVTELYLYIYPPKEPSLNLENLTTYSYDYNYITTGYRVYLYNNESKLYNYYLYSTYNVAFENLVNNMLSNTDVCSQNEDGSYNVNWQSTNAKFDSNYDLMQWLTEYAQQNIEYVNISPYEYGLYKIPEKSMRFNTLYLSKYFSFITDDYFPLFESYKVYFEYYAEDGNKIKDGIITYDGDYKFGETMFKILANNNNKDWKSGYVVFKEYNISANSGTEYVAKIVNSNPKVEIKIKDGTKFETNIYSSETDITCEQFEFKGEITEDTTIIVNHNNQKSYYNYYTYEPIKFNKIGSYEILVINTHKKYYTIKVNVQGLASSFEGVSNFGTTTQNVIFTTSDLNFKCYINGVLQTNLEHIINENQLYVIEFKKQNTDSNIHIEKDGRTFSFVIKGERELDLSDYKIEELSKYTLSEVRDYISQGTEKLNNLLLDINCLIEEFNLGYTQTLNSNSDNTNSQYEIIISTLLRAGEKKQQLELRYKELIDNNIVIEIVDEQKVNEINEKMELISALYNKKCESFKEFAIDYFDKEQGIIITDNIYEQLKEKQENEIINLYSEYLLEVQNYAKLSSKIVTMESYIHSYNNIIENYKKTLDGIYGYDVKDLQNAVSTLKQYEEDEKEYFETIANYKFELTIYGALNSTNIFVKEYLLSDAKAKIDSVIYSIDEYVKNKNFDIYKDIKEIAVKIAVEHKNDMNDLVKTTEEKYDECVELLEILNDEKRWWKVFSNISRNKKIKEYNTIIKNVTQDYIFTKDMYNMEASSILDLLNEINQSQNIIIEDYIFDDLINCQNSIDALSTKIIK